MFDKLDYKKWCLDNKIHTLFGVDVKNYGTIERKKTAGLYDSVVPGNTTPLPPELDDLVRLHYLVRSRKVTTVLEFGVGRSTIVMADALARNKKEYGDFVKKNLRRAHPFEIHAVDASKKWIRTTATSLPSELSSFVTFHYSAVEMTTFNGRACTMYKTLPNVCPDLIYLDAPDQFSIKNTVRGISTASADRLPMAADILLFEPFLLPGTLIVVDGRTANARFLKNNLQRPWTYEHLTAQDIHLFELVEPPLGKFNAAHIHFSLGKNTPNATL